MHQAGAAVDCHQRVSERAIAEPERYLKANIIKAARGINLAEQQIGCRERVSQVQNTRHDGKTGKTILGVDAKLVVAKQPPGVPDNTLFAEGKFGQGRY